MSPSTHSKTPARPLHVRALAALLALSLAVPAQAATALADQPLFATSNVPGNLALPLSVEFPTAVSVAHVSNTYVPATTYQGYFDAEKCYRYVFVDVETATAKTHFAPAGAATAHTCPGTAHYLWSGNYLNWAATQTIDPFRWALTGGYRVVDTPTLTLLEKAWHSGQGGTGNFPDRVLTTAADINNATPFNANGNFIAYVQGRGANAQFTSAGTANTGGMLGTYFNTMNLDATGATPVLTRVETVNFDWGNGSPGTGVNAEQFSARWVSSQTAPSTGTYLFQTNSDDGVRLYVNGTLVIDNWNDHAATLNTSTAVVLNAGDPLNVRLEYYENTGGAVMQLTWRPPGAAAYAAYTGGANWLAPIRVKVCDPSLDAGGLESNCTAYSGGNYKPEGLMQQYANRIRYSVFGYLNDDNIRRDGGVLRARQKFVGPLQPVPGSSDITNPAAEWSATTGVYVTNPDTADAADTAQQFDTAISNSGVLNYLNKFGEINRGTYKTYDPVSELYYAALRYYKNLGNVSAWTDMTGATAATRATWADGFPVITDWKKTVDARDTGDPILYSCQRNFILGIGDVNSHADKNVPGPSGRANEPDKVGGTFLGDTTFSDAINAVTATTKVGNLQGLPANFGLRETFPDCCNNNSPLMAGLAYDANTRDIRPDLPNLSGSIGQTVQTFWVDVMEGQVFKANNQYYLAAKYGGFKAPSNYDPYSATAALQTGWWYTTTDTVGTGGATQSRPDNYYPAGRPDQMISGLTKAFASIASQLKAYTTSFSTGLPQVSSSGNASFSAQYDAQTWTGELIASTLSFASGTGEPSAAESWRFGDKLEAQAAASGWNTGRRIVSWSPTAASGVPFRAASLTTTQTGALNTSYRSGDDSGDYLNYLRGDRSLEKANSSDATKPYRQRAKLLGDIVGSKARPVAPPNMPYSNAANPGYSTFKTTWASRPTVVYVGANDGMLHAINASLTGTDAGKEIFAYVPNALFSGPNATPNVDGLAAFGKPDFSHRNLVNATPNAYDIDFKKTSGATGTGTDWRTVLIGGLGKGGKSYYAIDVTNPAALMATTATELDTVAPRVLWEFTDADLGHTYGDPVVVKTRRDGWVVIFTSGYNNATGQSYFFIVNPRTGALIEKRATGAGSSSSDAGMAFVNAFVVDRTDGTADAAYAGDLLGNVYRLDLTGTPSQYPAPQKIALLTTSGSVVQPVTSRPLIEVQPNTNKRYVLVGTGRSLDTTDIASTQGQSFYAILDGTGTRFNASANLPAGVSFPIERDELTENTNLLTGVTLAANKVGWYVELGSGASSIGWRVTSDPTTYYGTVAFAASLPNGSACEPSGSSRIYAIDFGTGVSSLTSTTSTTDGNGNTTSTTTSMAYSTAVSGVVTDLRYFSVGGTPRLVAGSDTGGLKTIDGRFGSAVALRRLNWRELPRQD